MWIKNIEDYILYEDKAILVCRKPAGIAVQNAKVGSMDLESLLKNYIAQKNPGQIPYVGVIHRLDQPVEGILVFALDKKAAAGLNRQMTGGQIAKTYLAAVSGKCKVKQGTLEDWMKKDSKTNTSAVVSQGTQGAKKARLSYEVLEEQEERSLVKIHLETGRHHQIRVQMSHAGMPLLGDRKYNPEEKFDGQLALCSAELAFQHPVTGKKMKFSIKPEGKGFEIFL